MNQIDWSVIFPQAVSAYTVVAVLVALVLQIVDVLSTSLALERTNAREANPIIRFAMTRFSTGAWILAKLAVSIIAIWAIASHDQAVLLWILNAAYLWVVVRNISIAID